MFFFFLGLSGKISAPVRIRITVLNYFIGLISCPRSHEDLQAGIAVLRHASRVCFELSGANSLPFHAVGSIMGDVIYGGHVAEQLDWQAVKSLAQRISSGQSAEVGSVDVVPS